MVDCGDGGVIWNAENALFRFRLGVGLRWGGGGCGSLLGDVAECLGHGCFARFQGSGTVELGGLRGRSPPEAPLAHEHS